MNAPVDLRAREATEQRPPLLIAHRGAVGPGVPENSLAALRRASESGYHLVEIDVDWTRDGVPVLFHSDRAGSMWVNCGMDAAGGELSSDNLRAVRYRASDQHIPTLDEALAVCAAVGLGVVLDIKAAAAPAGSLALAGRFCPAFADRLSADEVTALRARGALGRAPVATRLYPLHAHHQLARDDVARLAAAGAHAFLIDDAYRDLFQTGAGGVGGEDRLHVQLPPGAVDRDAGGSA
jgi:glycerophosphoryl diester phosphodiesterase